MNNACASATTIGNGSFAGTTVGATNDGRSTCGAADASLDVWYSYTATCTGVLTVDTCTASSYDTVISVHSACPGTTSNQLTCNDDAQTPSACAGSLRSYANVNVTAGTNYKIRVTGYNGASGTFTLRVICGAGPLDNQCPCDLGQRRPHQLQRLLRLHHRVHERRRRLQRLGEVNTQDLFDFLACFFDPSGCNR